MNTEQQITVKLQEALAPQHLQVINESPQHNVPPGAQSHFKVIVVSEKFAGQSLVMRHREIHQILKDELKTDIHALSLHTYDPQEWEEQGGAPESPACLGGE